MQCTSCQRRLLDADELKRGTCARCAREHEGTTLSKRPSSRSERGGTATTTSASMRPRKSERTGSIVGSGKKATTTVADPTGTRAVAPPKSAGPRGGPGSAHKDSSKPPVPKFRKTKPKPSKKKPSPLVPSKPDKESSYERMCFEEDEKHSGRSGVIYPPPRVGEEALPEEEEEAEGEEEEQKEHEHEHEQEQEQEQEQEEEQEQQEQEQEEVKSKEKVVERTPMQRSEGLMATEASNLARREELRRLRAEERHRWEEEDRKREEERRARLARRHSLFADVGSSISHDETVTAREEKKTTQEEPPQRSPPVTKSRSQKEKVGGEERRARLAKRHSLLVDVGSSVSHDETVPARVEKKTAQGEPPRRLPPVTKSRSQKEKVGEQQQQRRQDRERQWETEFAELRRKKREYEEAERKRVEEEKRRREEERQRKEDALQKKLQVKREEEVQRRRAIEELARKERDERAMREKERRREEEERFMRERRDAQQQRKEEEERLQQEMKERADREARELEEMKAEAKKLLGQDVEDRIRREREQKIREVEEQRARKEAEDRRIHEEEEKEHHKRILLREEEERKIREEEERKIREEEEHRIREEVRRQYEENKRREEEGYRLLREEEERKIREEEERKIREEEARYGEEDHGAEEKICADQESTMASKPVEQIRELTAEEKARKREEDLERRARELLEEARREVEEEEEEEKHREGEQRRQREDEEQERLAEERRIHEEQEREKERLAEERRIHEEQEREKECLAEERRIHEEQEREKERLAEERRIHEEQEREKERLAEERRIHEEQEREKEHMAEEQQIEERIDSFGRKGSLQLTFGYTNERVAAMNRIFDSVAGEEGQEQQFESDVDDGDIVLNLEKKVPPKRIVIGEWEEYTSLEGRRYWHSRNTGRRTFDMPGQVKDFYQKKIGVSSSTKSLSASEKEEAWKQRLEAVVRDEARKREIEKKQEAKIVATKKSKSNKAMIEFGVKKPAAEVPVIETSKAKTEVEEEDVGREERSALRAETRAAISFMKDILLVQRDLSEEDEEQKIREEEERKEEERRIREEERREEERRMREEEARRMREEEERKEEERRIREEEERKEEARRIREEEARRMREEEERKEEERRIREEEERKEEARRMREEEERKEEERRIREEEERKEEARRMREEEERKEEERRIREEEARRIREEEERRDGMREEEERNEEEREEEEQKEKEWEGSEEGERSYPDESPVEEEATPDEWESLDGPDGLKYLQNVRTGETKPLDEVESIDESNGSKPALEEGSKKQEQNEDQGLDEADEWGQATSEDGRPYWYNKRTRVSVWERPSDIPKQAAETSAEPFTSEEMPAPAGLPASIEREDRSTQKPLRVGHIQVARGSVDLGTGRRSDSKTRLLVRMLSGDRFLAGVASPPQSPFSVPSSPTPTPEDDGVAHAILNDDTGKLLSFLCSEDAMIQYKALKGLAQSVVAQQEKQEIISGLGGIKDIVGLLRTTKNEDVQRQCARTLRSISYRNDVMRRQIAAEGGLEPLIDLIRKGGVAVQDDVMRALGNLLVIRENKVESMALGLLDAIAEVLGRENPELQIAATRVLVWLTIDNDVDVMEEDGILKRMIDFLLSPEEQLQDEALMVLTNMAGAKDEARTKMAEAGVICPLLELLSSPRADVRHKSAAVLSNLSQSEEVSTQIADAAGLAKLLDLVRREDEASLALALTALMNMSSVEDLHRSFVAAAALDPLAHLATHADQDLQVCALKCLGNLGRSEECADSMLTHGITGVLLSVLRSPSDDVKEQATYGLNALVTKAPFAREAIRQKGVELLLATATDSMSDTVQAHALYALHALSKIAEGNTTLMNDLNGPRHLLHILRKTKSGSTIVPLAKIIAGLAERSSACQQLLVDNHTLDILVGHMKAHTNTDTVQLHVARAIHNLAFKNDNVKVDAARLGCIELLVDMLGSSDEALRAEGANCIANLAINAQNKIIVADKGGLDALVPLLSADNPVTQEYAVKALANLSVNANNKRVIVAVGALPGLLELAYSPVEGIQRMVAGALGNIAMLPANRPKIIQGEGLSALEELMESKNLGVRKLAQTAYENLCMEEST